MHVKYFYIKKSKLSKKEALETKKTEKGTKLNKAVIFLNCKL